MLYQDESRCVCLSALLLIIYVLFVYLNALIGCLDVHL